MTLTVAQLMEACARHEGLQDEVRIEMPHPDGGLQATGVTRVDTDPMSGMFFIQAGEE